MRGLGNGDEKQLTCRTFPQPMSRFSLTAVCDSPVGQRGGEGDETDKLEDETGGGWQDEAPEEDQVFAGGLDVGVK